MSHTGYPFFQFILCVEAAFWQRFAQIGAQEACAHVFIDGRELLNYNKSKIITEGGAGMVIKSATTLRNDYDNVVKLSKAKQEPIFITRNGEGEMVFLPIEMWEKREAELNLLDKLLKREQSRIAGARTFTMAEMEALTEAELREG